MKKEKRYFCDVISKLIYNKFVVCIFLILTLLFATYWHLYYNQKICDRRHLDCCRGFFEYRFFLFRQNGIWSDEGEKV